MDNVIEHTGIIRSIDGNRATVALLSDVSCTGCSLSAICGTKVSGNENILTVYIQDTSEEYSLGEEVTVTIPVDLESGAVMKAFLFPCLILLFAVIATYIATGNEFIAASAGLVATCIYYFILYLERNTLRKKFKFLIKKR